MSGKEGNLSRSESLTKEVGTLWLLCLSQDHVSGL